MKKLSARERTLAGLLIMAVASFLFFLLVLRPMRAEADQLARSAREQRDQKNEQERLLASLPRLRQQAADLGARIAVLSRPDANPTPEVVREIERLTREQGLELTGIHPAEPEYLDGSTKYTTTFDARASFDQVVKLLHELETSPNFLWVEGVEISGDRGNGALTMNAVVAVYSSHSASRPSHAKK